MPTEQPRQVQVSLEQEMRVSYLDYAMSVIVGRALPDVRDGLKPVHRRILYAMFREGLLATRRYSKCAGVVGEVIKKYHPHGDVAVYDALVRMAQDFNMRYPLVDGQGNFGCFAGSTRVRLADGTTRSFEELATDDAAGKGHFTYTVDGTGRIVFAPIRAPRLTKRQAPVVRVVLDNHEEIVCTPDHRFMLRRGGYKEARALEPGESLMPLYSRAYEGSDANLQGYEEIYQPSLAYAGQLNHKVVSVEPAGYADVYDLTVDGSHNFALAAGVFVHNSVDGDPPAAYRYTEARLTRLAEEMLADIDLETVDFVPNYDESTMEPAVLPTRVPNLLINGSSGIAVGMATNMPTHNLGEVVSGLLLLLDEPEVSDDALLDTVKGPDFPTAGFICGRKGIEEVYRTGRGTLVIRGRAVVEVHPKTEREIIIVTELPYQVNKARLIEKAAELVRDRKIEGISDLRDESGREGMRIVIELKRGETAAVVLNQLYRHTQLQTTFGAIMLALVDGQPQVLTLRALLTHFLDFRREVVLQRTRFELRKAEERAHILEGLKKALDHLDAVITLIKGSRSPEAARDGLVRRFEMTEVQAQAVLDMKLQRLTGLEREKLRQDYQDTIERIAYLNEVLTNDALVKKIIGDELREVKEKYQDARRTEIIGEASELNPEDLIAAEEMVITISHAGYIKRNPVTVYRSQRRGGKGKIAMGTKEEDFVEHLFIASTHDLLLFFTDAGRVFWLKVHELPEAGRAAKGKAIVNLVQMAQGEKLTAVLPVAEFRDDLFVVMATKQGVIKKTPLAAYSNPRAGGIIALTLDEGDRLVAARLTDGTKEIMLGTRRGIVIRFREAAARPMGRTARGVRGMTLSDGDEIIGMEVVRDHSTILMVTERGYGKRTALSAYRLQGRGGKGIIGIRTGDRNGAAIGALQVSEDQGIMLMTAEGKAIRLPIKGVRAIGRATQGVKLIGMEATDRVVAVAPLAEDEDNGAPAGEAAPA